MSPPDPASLVDDSATVAVDDNGAPTAADAMSPADPDPAAVETAAQSLDASPLSGEPPGEVDAGRAVTFLGLSRSDTRFAVLAGTVILVLLLAHWVKLSVRGESRVEIDRLESRVYEFQLDVNRATWVEWMQLEGIGEALARRIVADRESNGPFTGVEDLRRVKGIGPKTLDAMRPHLRCPDCPTTGTPP